MNDLQKELQELKAKVADLESRIAAEPVKWQPKGGNWFIYGDGGMYEGMGLETERATQEQAQRAAVEMRKFNRLLALRDELCGDELVAWGDDYTEKYNIYFSHERGRWYISPDLFCESITPYFTTDESAQRACDMLNSGEVEL